MTRTLQMMWDKPSTLTDASFVWAVWCSSKRYKAANLFSQIQHFNLTQTSSAHVTLTVLWPGIMFNSFSWVLMIYQQPSVAKLIICCVTHSKCTLHPVWICVSSYRCWQSVVYCCVCVCQLPGCGCVHLDNYWTETIQLWSQPSVGAMTLSISVYTHASRELTPLMSNTKHHYQQA